MRGILVALYSNRPFYRYVLNAKPLILSEAEDDIVVIETSI